MPGCVRACMQGGRVQCARQHEQLPRPAQHPRCRRQAAAAASQQAVAHPHMGVGAAQLADMHCARRTAHSSAAFASSNGWCMHQHCTLSPRAVGPNCTHARSYNPQPRRRGHAWLQAARVSGLLGAAACNGGGCTEGHALSGLLPSTMPDCGEGNGVWRPPSHSQSKSVHTHGCTHTCAHAHAVAGLPAGSVAARGSAALGVRHWLAPPCSR